MKESTLKQRSKFLLQFMFRERHRDNLFVAFIKLLSYLYFFLHPGYPIRFVLLKAVVIL
jgi:hypothetical protein